MKVKEAKKLLEGCSGEELYQQGCLIFREEVNNLITLRSHGGKPTRGVVNSAINQVEDWFIKVADGLPWQESGIPKNIISWETGRLYAEYGFVNPEIERYRDRVRKEVLRGTPLPLLEALTPGALDAIGSLMIGQLKVEATLYLKKEEFLERTGRKACPYNEKERFCKYQSTYLMVEGLPSGLSEVVFYLLH